MPVRRHRSNLARLDSTETASPCSSGNTTRESPQALLTLPEAVDPDATVQPCCRKSLPLCDSPAPYPSTMQLASTLTSLSQLVWAP